MNAYIVPVLAFLSPTSGLLSYYVWRLKKRLDASDLQTQALHQKLTVAAAKCKHCGRHILSRTTNADGSIECPDKRTCALVRKNQGGA